MAADLGQGILLGCARDPLDRSLLTAGERATLGCLETDQRALRWLRGRKALHRVMRRRGVEPDTSRLRFPHAGYSLTHSDGLALAVAGETHGLGVDFEHPRPMRQQAARFFLTDEEQSWIESQQAGRRSAQLLRLWTVKEALFKADAHNDRRTLRDYTLQAPAAIAGYALTADCASQRYTTREIAGGLLSVAITEEPTC